MPEWPPVVELVHTSGITDDTMLGYLANGAGVRPDGEVQELVDNLLHSPVVDPDNLKKRRLSRLEAATVAAAQLTLAGLIAEQFGYKVVPNTPEEQ
jgi:hypothetical protein